MPLQGRPLSLLAFTLVGLNRLIKLTSATLLNSK